MQELAWASYSLLRNTNSTGLLVADSTGSMTSHQGDREAASQPAKGHLGSASCAAGAWSLAQRDERSDLLLDREKWPYLSSGIGTRSMPQW